MSAAADNSALAAYFLRGANNNTIPPLLDAAMTKVYPWRLVLVVDEQVVAMDGGGRLQP
jgi:hypothetical protein